MCHMKIYLSKLDGGSTIHKYQDIWARINNKIKNAEREKIGAVLMLSLSPQQAGDCGCPMSPPISTPSTAPHPTGGLRSSLPQQAGGCCPCPPGLRPTRGRAHKLPGAHTKARVRGRACCVQELLARTGGRVGRELVPAAARASAHVGTAWPDFVPAAFSVRTRSSPLSR